MNSNIKIIDVVKQFDCEGDIEALILKEEMVFKSQRLNEELILPTLLEKEAFAEYLKMNEEDKKSVNKIKERLRKVFGENPFIAFRRLCTKRWNGEPINVYFT